MKNLLTASVLSLSFLAGCDAHVDQDNPGESLRKLQGQVTNPADGQSPALEVVLWWGGGIIGATAPITGDSPVTFELPLLTPPPEAAMSHDAETGVDFTVAWIIAMPKGATSGSVIGPESASQIQGAAPEHIVIYTSAPVAAETWFAAIHGGGSFSAGYHLRRVDNPTEEEMEAYWACHEVFRAKCPFDQPYDAECKAARDACSHPQARILPTSEDESISLILGPFNTLKVPDFF